jgi:hypothetical protein
MAYVSAATQNVSQSATRAGMLWSLGLAHSEFRQKMAAKRVQRLTMEAARFLHTKIMDRMGLCMLFGKSGFPFQASGS